MKVEKITINQLQPADYNPRQITDEDLNTLTDNLEEFGLVDPIIVDLTDDNTIIGGHQRYKVIENKHDTDYKLNMIRLGDIGWVFDETQLKIPDKNHQKALNLSLNKISGEWDVPKLDRILVELKDNHFDIELTGFELKTDFNINNPLLTTEDTTDKDEIIIEKAEKGEIPEEDPSEIVDETTDNTPEDEEVHHKYILEVELNSEQELETTYEKLSEEGYKCRVLTV